jgi:undecaprenyl-diphosphatase
MGKILVVLLWPVVLALIFIAAGVWASRVPQMAPAGPRNGGMGIGSWAERRTTRASGGTIRTALTGVITFLAVIVVGAVVIFGVMSVLGLIAKSAGPTIDKPIFHWMASHRVHFWKTVMSSATKSGNTWTVRGAAVTAAVCLAVVYRRDRWLPPVAIGTMILLQRALTVAIHHVVHRPPPPGPFHGIFPSGGSERTIIFYGMIAYLLYREFSGSRRAAIWSAAVVAALAFDEGYSRIYLGMHWFTDVLGGWAYGALLLVVFITGIRVVMGPPRVRAAELLAEPVVAASAADRARSTSRAGAAQNGPAHDGILTGGHLTEFGVRADGSLEGRDAVGGPGTRTSGADQ